MLQAEGPFIVTNRMRPTAQNRDTPTDSILNSAEIVLGTSQFLGAPEDSQSFTVRQMKLTLSYYTDTDRCFNYDDYSTVLTVIEPHGVPCHLIPSISSGRTPSAEPHHAFQFPERLQHHTRLVPQRYTSSCILTGFVLWSSCVCTLNRSIICLGARFFFAAFSATVVALFRFESLIFFSGGNYC
jgi:hypothetical protein